jgi:hypothetical protein
MLEYLLERLTMKRLARHLGQVDSQRVFNVCWMLALARISHGISWKRYCPQLSLTGTAGAFRPSADL